MRIKFIKQLWDVFMSGSTALSDDSPSETCSSITPPKASGARSLASRCAELPTVEHTRLSRKANIITKMESGLGRQLSDAERDSLLNKAQADKLAESKKALEAYSNREKAKFSYTFTKPEGDKK